MLIVIDIPTTERMTRRFGLPLPRNVVPCCAGGGRGDQPVLLIHTISVLGAAIIEKPEPLWDLMVWHGRVIENVLAGVGAFRDLVGRGS